MKKKGFTLIELLGVVVLLAALGLIIYPVVNNTLRDNKTKLFKKQISELERVFYNYSLDHQLGYEDNVEKELAFSELMASGYIRSGDIMNPLTGEKLEGCLVYKWVESKKEYEVNYSEECRTTEIIELTSTFYPQPSDTWYNTDFSVDVRVDGAKKIQWCTKTEEACDNYGMGESDVVTVPVETEGSKNKVCVIGFDENGNHTWEMCNNDYYKLDKTGPTFFGLGTITVEVGDSVDLNENVRISDSLSGVANDKDYTISQATVDTSVPGTTKVVYQAFDKAGNKTEMEREIKVKSSNSKAPEIYFTATGTSINGWYIEDFHVTITAIDKSGSGIKTTKWCANAGNTCNPDTTGNIAAISTNGSNYMVCAKVEDNGGNVSESCTGPYNLDKNAPIIIAKKTSYNIFGGTSTDIASEYFTIKNEGAADITNTRCISNKDGKVSNTSQLTPGTHTVTCTVEKANGKTSSASITINYKESIIETDSSGNEICFLGNNKKIALNEFYTGEAGATKIIGIDSFLKQINGAYSVALSSGIYKDASGACRYVGGEPNNYIKIGDKFWRILSIDEQGIKIMYYNSDYVNYFFDGGIGSKNYDIAQTYCEKQNENDYYSNIINCGNGYGLFKSYIPSDDDSKFIQIAYYSRYNENNSYCKNSETYKSGCNIWSKASEISQYGQTPNNNISYMYEGSIYGGTVTNDSYIKIKFEEFYENDLKRIDNYIVEAEWNVAPLYKNLTSYNSIEDLLEAEKNWTWKGKIGLMNPSDYLLSQVSCSGDVITGLGRSNAYCDKILSKEGYKINYLKNLIVDGDYAADYVVSSYYTMNPVLGDYARIHLAGSSNTGEAYYEYAANVAGYSDPTTFALPVIYLKHDIKFLGSGTGTDPYCIENSETTIPNDCY